MLPLIKRKKVNKFNITIIDNIHNNEKIDNFIPELVYKTVKKSLLNNENNTYTIEEIKSQLSRKSVERVRREIQDKFFVYIEVDNHIVAFAAISKKENKYEYSWLQVLPEHQGNGYANILSDISDKFIILLGVKEVFIESFQFPSTINFHKKRGFKKYYTQEGMTENLKMIKYF